MVGKLNYKIFSSIINKKVYLTNERKKHISERHPDIAQHISKVKIILLKPDQIRKDSNDPKVLLFYKHFSNMNKFLVVVIKINARNFILTFYSTYRVKTGKAYKNYGEKQ